MSLFVCGQETHTQAPQLLFFHTSVHVTADPTLIHFYSNSLDSIQAQLPPHSSTRPWGTWSPPLGAAILPPGVDNPPFSDRIEQEVLILILAI